MKKINLVVLLLISVLSFCCKDESRKTEEVTFERAAQIYGDVTLEEAKTLIKSNKNLVIIDVRTPSEIAEGKIEGALEMDINDPSFTDRIAQLSDDDEYLIYCRSGARSARAMQQLKSIDVDKVYNLLGGFTSWKAAGQ